MRPLIGLTTRNIISPKYNIPMVASPKSYSEALLKAGALPVLIPLNTPEEEFEALLERIDGIIFTGGGDIETARYQGETHEKVGDVDQERDQIELSLVHKVVEIEMPFLGICRGFQVINVAYGGTLYSHISDQLDNSLEHSCFPDFPWDHIAHEVEVEGGSKLAEILGKTSVEVNSLHHQGAKEIGEGLVVTAKAPDGLVEGLELPDYPFGVAVQWHPEWMPDSVPMQRIFNAFLNAARGYRG